MIFEIGDSSVFKKKQLIVGLEIGLFTVHVRMNYHLYFNLL